jgi:hypothetical protein
MDGGSAIDEVVKRLPLDDVEAMLSRRGLPSVVHRGAPRRARGLLAAALKDGMCEWTCEAGVQDGYHDRELGRGVAARRGGTPQPAAEPRAEPSSRPPPAIASVHCSLHVIGDSIFAFGSSDKHQDQFTVGGGTSPPATAVSAPCAPARTSVTAPARAWDTLRSRTTAACTSFPSTPAARAARRGRSTPRPRAGTSSKRAAWGPTAR